MRRLPWKNAAGLQVAGAALHPTIPQPRVAPCSTGARSRRGSACDRLSAATSRRAEIRIYNPLFAKPNPDAGNFAADLNPQSLEILGDARIEPAIAETSSSDVIQFERQGYFVRDPESTPDRPVFNRTIGLRDTFAKEVGGKG